jgi:sterol carrier protein 2
METSQSKPPQNRVFVIGVGMTKFLKPGKHNFDYPDLAKLAMSRALRDANLSYNSMQ